MSQHEENLQECEFVNETILNNILPAMITRSNTIAKVHDCSNITTFIEHSGLKKTGYSLTNLKQYRMFFMLKKTLGLGVPRKIYAAKDKVCVVIYEDAVYVIAPRIDLD